MNALHSLINNFYKLSNLDKVPNGEYGYHITYYKNLPSIINKGLTPQGGVGSLGVGGYAGHSKGNLFLTEESGISFWYNKMEDMAEHNSDNPFEDELVPIVLRFPWPKNLTWDEPGSTDSLNDAFMTSSHIDADYIELYDGSGWLPIEDYHFVDISEAFDIEEEFDENIEESIELYYFKTQNPLKP